MTKETVLNDLKSNLVKTISHLREGLISIRTGRASAALVENIKVDYYGALTPLKQVANINIPEAKVIVIQPYDQNSMDAVEKAIQESELNLNPQRDSQLIRIVLPDLTEERRNELTKILDQKLEESKISARNHREEAWKQIKGMKDDGGISEDEMYKVQDELNKQIDDINSEIDKIGEAKRKEITTI